MLNQLQYVRELLQFAQSAAAGKFCRRQRRSFKKVLKEIKENGEGKEQQHVIDEGASFCFG